ncbi:MAG: PEP-CTERM sorting domain-containing protein [Planctomycetaceae bacterium]
MKRFSVMLLAVAAVAMAVQSAQAHTVQVGYTDNGDGTVTFYAGSYHDPTEAPSPVGGLVIVAGPAGVGTHAFTGFIAPGALPTLDGLYIADGGSNTVVHWQTVTVAGLVGGAYSVSTTSTNQVVEPWPFDSGFPGLLTVNVTNGVVPEPASVVLFGLTALGMGVIARRRRKQGNPAEGSPVC